MDGTAVYMNCEFKRTVHTKGDNTVSVMFRVSSLKRLTLGVTMAMDGRKLPSFVIFRRTPGGRIGKSPCSVLLDGII